jgi:hypothetical protein
LLRNITIGLIGLLDEIYKLQRGDRQGRRKSSAIVLAHIATTRASQNQSHMAAK